MKSTKPAVTLVFGLTMPLLVFLVGCRGHQVRIVCGPRINSFGAPPESKGRALEIAMISLSEENIQKLARANLLGKVSLDDDEDQVFQNITAEEWFNGKGVRAKQILPNEGDIIEVTVRPAEPPRAVAINRSGMWSKRAGILALANFSGTGDEKNRELFQTSAWAPSRGRVTSGAPELRVNETTIMWAE